MAPNYYPQMKNHDFDQLRIHKETIFLHWTSQIPLERRGDTIDQESDTANSMM